MASLMSAKSIEFPDSATLDTHTEYQRAQHLTPATSVSSREVRVQGIKLSQESIWPSTFFAFCPWHWARQKPYTRGSN